MDQARNGPIASLRAQGHSIRAIARQVGLSRSRVHEIVSGLAADDDTDPDPWDDDTDEEHLPTEPFTFVGYERQWFTRGPGNGGYWAEMERWVDAEGASLADERESAEMALYRYRAHVANELEDPSGPTRRPPIGRPNGTPTTSGRGRGGPSKHPCRGQADASL